MLSPPCLCPSGAQTGAHLRLKLWETCPWVPVGTGTHRPGLWGSSALSFLGGRSPSIPGVTVRCSQQQSCPRQAMQLQDVECCKMSMQPPPDRGKTDRQPWPHTAGLILHPNLPVVHHLRALGPALTSPSTALFFRGRRGEGHHAASIAANRMHQHSIGAFITPSCELGCGHPHPPVQGMRSPGCRVRGFIWVPPRRVLAGRCTQFSGCVW